VSNPEPERNAYVDMAELSLRVQKPFTAKCAKNGREERKEERKLSQLLAKK